MDNYLLLEIPLPLPSEPEPEDEEECEFVVKDYLAEWRCCVDI
jgi:hypothetical protein